MKEDRLTTIKIKITIIKNTIITITTIKKTITKIKTKVKLDL